VVSFRRRLVDHRQQLHDYHRRQLLFDSQKRERLYRYFAHGDGNGKQSGNERSNGHCLQMRIRHVELLRYMQNE
jgi:hypothetical protein